MKKSSETGICRWNNGEKRCTICSKRETTPKGKDKAWKVTFSGWNPFPCYSMVTTIDVLFNWLINNGWKLEPGGTRTVTQTEIDDRTGEVISERKFTTIWIPV